jgi:hypothetical protein
MESPLKLFVNDDCTIPISETESEPIPVGIKTQKNLWLKNTSVNITYSAIKVLVNDSDVSILKLPKTELLPFDKTKITLVFNPKQDRRTAFNFQLQLEANGLIGYLP